MSVKAERRGECRSCRHAEHDGHCRWFEPEDLGNVVRVRYCTCQRGHYEPVAAGPVVVVHNKEASDG